MKKALVVVLGFASLVAIAFVLGLALARGAEKESDLALQRFAADAREPVRIVERNAAARQLEALTRPLAIELRPRKPALTDAVEFDSALMRSMGGWLRIHEERATEEVDAPPAEVAEWLTRHEGELERVANALIGGEVPRWRSGEDLPAGEAPVPNLLGHINLLRVLTVATLERERRGDHEGAWKLQHAAWKLTSGLFDRPEMISTLIGIAGVRMSAAVQRKLEAPVPLWRAEVAQRAFTTEMLDAVRTEFADISKRARTSSPRELTGAADEIHTVAAATIAAPAFRWGIAENLRAAFEQLDAVRTEDPCAAARHEIAAAIDADTPAIARRFGRLFLPNLKSAIDRAALADIAVEGTSKVLALKSARASTPDGEWPAPDAAIGRSRCEGEQWAYAVDGDGGMTLRFSGRVPDPANFRGSMIPMEHTAR